jgi:sigma-B regulation protein RsbU (phosphoserine phosphatase)
VLGDMFAIAIAEGVFAHGQHQKRVDAAQLMLQREAQYAAQAERDAQHALFMQAPVAIAILEGPQHLFTFANPAYRALVGGRDVVGKELLEALPDVAKYGFSALLDQVMETGETFYGVEVPIKLEHHADGECLMLNFAYTAKRNATGGIDGVLVSGWDVTEQVKARRHVYELAEEVRASEAELRLVTDAIPVLVSFVTADERYRFVNKAYEDWFGQPREYYTGRTLIEVIGEGAYQKLEPYVRRGLAGEQFSVEQHGVPYRFGGTRDVKVQFVPHRDASGAVDGYVALLEDITEARRAQAERERLALQRTEVLESMGDVFFALDASFRIDLVNRNFERVFQKRREDTVGRSLWDVFPAVSNPTSRFFEEYHRCMEERVDVQFVDYYDALEVWTDVRAYPTGDGGIAVFVRDVSAEKRAQIALKSQAEFEQQLIGIVSHDLRNPLNVIVLGSALLIRSEELSERDTKSVVRIQNAADRATRLIRDLLDFTQARLGGGIAVEPRPSDLRAIVDGVMEEIEAAYPARQIEVLHEGDAHGAWDPDRVAQVVQNLATNALKYSPPGSAVQVVTWGREAEITLLFRNHGAPIPAEKIATLFEPFERAVGQIDRASRSVGLGLYIVKQLVDAHHGSVEVQSSQAEGTTFTVTLPRYASTARN